MSTGLLRISNRATNVMPDTSLIFDLVQVVEQLAAAGIQDSLAPGARRKRHPANAIQLSPIRPVELPTFPLPLAPFACVICLAGYSSDKVGYP